MALAVDSQESGGTAHRGTASGTALTWSFNNVGGNLLVVAVIVTGNAGQVAAITAGPTYDGVAMTQVASSQQTWGTNASITALYYLLNPATGSKTVSVTGTSVPTNFAILAGAISFSGALAVTSTATTGTNTSGTTATASNITTASGNMVFASGGWGSGETGVAGAGFTRTFLVNGSSGTSGDDLLGEYGVSTGAAISPTFTWGVSDSWRIVAVEILAAADSIVHIQASSYLGAAKRGPLSKAFRLVQRRPLVPLIVANPDVTVALTGVLATMSTGTLGVNVDVPITGVLATGATGTLTPNNTHALTGVGATGSTGTLAPATTVAVSGVGATGAVGVLTPSTIVTVNGVLATGAAGVLTPVTSVTVSGVLATGSVGTLAPSTTITLLGVLATGGTGTVTASGGDPPLASGASEIILVLPDGRLAKRITDKVYQLLD